MVQVNDTVGVVTPTLPAEPLVQDVCQNVGTPVTVALALHPVGFTLVQPVNVRPVRFPETDTPAPPPEPPTNICVIDAVQVMVGLESPPDVVSTAVVPDFRLVPIVVPLGNGLGQGDVAVPQSLVAEAAGTPTNAIRTRAPPAIEQNILRVRIEELRSSCCLSLIAQQC
jgi:hypothetical protein